MSFSFLFDKAKNVLAFIPGKKMFMYGAGAGFLIGSWTVGYIDSIKIDRLKNSLETAQIETEEALLHCDQEILRIQEENTRAINELQLQSEAALAKSKEELELVKKSIKNILSKQRATNNTLLNTLKAEEKTTSCEVLSSELLRRLNEIRVGSGI